VLGYCRDVPVVPVVPVVPDVSGYCREVPAVPLDPVVPLVPEVPEVPGELVCANTPIGRSNDKAASIDIYFLFFMRLCGSILRAGVHV